ncbi:MAG: transporter [Bacteroidota bacterium]|nr:transporter [Bacteroidota bacterium]MDP4229273.1 transporter [Bacteroidota bacterium]MDP4235792.1 transporter [Bacteroidota bacterium]
MKKNIIVLTLTLFFVGAFVCQYSYAQGCVVQRQCAPEFGADGSPYLMPGQWQVDASFRYLDASRHYNGTVEQTQRETQGTFVMNRQRILNVAGSYGISDQFSASINIPYLVHGEWGLPLPFGKAATDSTAAVPNGPRWNQNTSGIGDITVSGKYWFLNVKENHDQNIMLGIGIKIPTGNSNVQVNYPTISGAASTVQLRSADQSIQPGDGGWGIPLELEAFKTIGDFSAFMTATYLINPRDTNETPSIVTTLGIAPTLATLYRVHNTVQDQYLFKIGVAYQVMQSLSVSLAGRIEGVPVKDLIGGNDGFRRPGTASFIEPGVVWNSPSFGSFSASAPITMTRDRAADAFGFAGDATFADYVILVGYSYRF